MQMYELSCVYGGRQSFYGKAKVVIDGNVERLFSYNTEVARMTDGKVDFVNRGYSQTTDRHIREWLLQHNLDPKDYK